MKKIEKFSKRKKNYTFFKNILSSIIGTTIAGMIVFFLILSTIISLLTTDTKEITKNIKPNSVLKIKLNYPIYDSPNTEFNSISALNNISNPNADDNLNLYSVLLAIELAKKNNNISGILLELDEFEGPSGWASLKEIRDALLNFKDSGKFIWSYSRYLSQSAYYLASTSDSILIYPQTGVDFRGLNMTYVFLTESLNEIGIKPEIIRSGKYKSAIEPFMLKKMSQENKEQSQLILKNIWTQTISDIAKDRKVTEKKLNLSANNTLENWIINKNSILIDSQKYPQEVSNLLKEKINIGKVKNTFGLYDEKISFVSLSDVLKTIKSSKAENQIGIIYAEGEISDQDNDQISPQSHSKLIRKLKEDDNIKVVILRVNSPGGSALASDMIWYELEQLKKIKPLIVSMGDVAASGGYYISCGADKIFASNNTITGSIGVFGLFFKMEDLLKNKLKLHFDEINTNDFSNFGNISRVFNTEEKEILGNLIDQTYGTFLERVSDGRNKNKKEINEIAQGRIWSGKEAKKVGLVDEIGNLNDAIKYAAKIANLNNYQVVEYPKKKDFFQIIMEEFQTNYKNYDDLHSFINHWKIEKIKNLLKNKQGIQTRLPSDININ